MKKDILGSGLLTAKGDFRQLVSLCMGKAYTNQLVMGELVQKGRNWSVDLGTGIIQFGEDSFPMQLLGSESYSSNTWLWGWANQGDFPENIMQDALRLKEIGEKLGYWEFTEAEADIDSSDGLLTGHVLGSVAAALSETPACYYRCPYDGGAAYVLVKELPEAVYAPVGMQDFIQALQNLFGQFVLDHRMLVKGMLFQNGVAYEEKEEDIVAAFPGSQQIILKFDELNRLTAVNATMKEGGE